MNLSLHSNVNSNILLSFTDKTNLPILKFLKRGFRHCSIYIQIDHDIFLIDPLSNLLIINKVKERSMVQLIDRLKDEDNICLLIPTRPSAPTSPTFPLPLTCVEITKRLLAIQNPYILTPWQLYKLLLEQNMNIYIDFHCKRNIYRTSFLENCSLFFKKLFKRTKREYIMGGLTGGSAPAPVAEPVEEEVDPEEDKRKNRLELIRRRRRGRAGTVHTGWAGDKVEIPEALANSSSSDSDSNYTATKVDLKTNLGG